MTSTGNNYVAPITLGFTPADGDLIGGTVNGVEVNGKWNDGVALYKGALDVSTYKNDSPQQVCSVWIIDGQALIGVRSESAPTTDYELHLYRYTPAAIVQIPQEYVEGLEATAADATAAKTAAETAQSTANKAKTIAETAQSTANNALTIENGGISKGVIGGTTIKAASSPSTNEYLASLDYQGLKFYQNSADVPYTRIDSDGYSVFGYIDTKHITLSPGIRSSVDAYILINSDDTKSVSIRANGEITVVNPDNTLELLGATALIVESSTPDSTKKIKLTVSDDARPTFTDTSDPNNTWTPGENLPTVTASDSGKFLRVSESGAWAAEETAIPSQPIIVDAEANMSTGSITISSEDNIQKMNAIDTAYKAGKPCSAYLRYLVNNSYMWCALIAAIGSSDSYNFLFASSRPNHQLRVAPSTNGDWIVTDDGPTEN